VVFPGKIRVVFPHAVITFIAGESTIPFLQHRNVNHLLRIMISHSDFKHSYAFSTLWYAGIFQGLILSKMSFFARSYNNELITKYGLKDGEFDFFLVGTQAIVTIFFRR